MERNEYICRTKNEGTMTPRKATGIYFSPTDNSRRVCHALLQGIDTEVAEAHEVDITQPEKRQTVYRFGREELIVLTLPVYAGRIPNKLLPFVENNLKGDHTPAIIAVTYGNRSFDNALIEIRETLTQNGFEVAAAIAVPSQHAFSSQLATGRPNVSDLRKIQQFAHDAVGRLASREENRQLQLPGEWPSSYYIPKGEDNEPVNFLKAKPETDPNSCSRCGLCARLCPMGSINKEDPSLVEGTCIKCHSCIRHCPNGAKRFGDKAFISHVKMLETNYTEEKEITFFL